MMDPKHVSCLSNLIFLSKGLEATVFTYSSLINACVRGGDMDRAWNFLRQMQSAGIEPNEITWTTMIKGYCDISTPSHHYHFLLPTPLKIPFSHEVIVFYGKYNYFIDFCA